MVSITKKENIFWENFILDLNKNKERFNERDTFLYLSSSILSEVNRYIEQNFSRIFILYEDTIFLLEAEKLLSASITARSLFETVSMLNEFYRKIEASLKRSDLSTFRSTLSKFSFASSEFSEGDKISLPNVMDAVRTMENISPGCTKLYSVFCDAVHPNWSGRKVLKVNDHVNMDPITLRLYISILSLGKIVNLCVQRTEQYDKFMFSQRKNISKLLNDL